MKKKDREENSQKERSKKKKRLNDNRKLLNDRIKWKMQKKNIQESRLPSILMSWRIFCGAISVIIGRIVQVCFLQFYCQMSDCD
jgi:hypothetical protein